MFNKCVLSLLVVFICTSVQAGTLSPKETLDLKISDVSRILQNSEFDSGTKKQIAEKLICESFCLNSMSKFVLKERWEELSEQEKEKFSKHLSGLIVDFCLSAVKKYYVDGDVEHIKTISVCSNKSKIHTRIKKKGKNTEIVYSMNLVEGVWVIYDVKIEGVSMLRNYQAQFAKCKTEEFRAIVNPG